MHKKSVINKTCARPHAKKEGKNKKLKTYKQSPHPNLLE